MLPRLLIASALILGLGTTWALATTEPRIAPMEKVLVAPYASVAFEVNFVGQRPAAVICMGQGSSLLGLYVFDSHGNCVAHEDVTPKRPFRDSNLRYQPDDSSVVWFPVETGFHAIEVVNFGKRADVCAIAPK